MKYPVHFFVYQMHCLYKCSCDIYCHMLQGRSSASLAITNFPSPPLQGIPSISYIYVKCLKQSVSHSVEEFKHNVYLEITSDCTARNFCSLFSTMVLYFHPMKVGEEKSHPRKLKSLDDVLGCFYSLSMRASFSSFHSSGFINLLLSFQDFKKRPQKSH